ncbi:hypothetical protein SEVIR_4G072250v4 [Setaria viridis]
MNCSYNLPDKPVIVPLVLPSALVAKVPSSLAF